MKIQDLPKPLASLAQRGLASLGFYSGTFGGVPGPKTLRAYEAYLAAGEGDLPKKGSLASRIVLLARGEVGVREEPKDSNRGKRVQEYQAATWLEGTGWPWCAAFICWLCREVGVSEEVRPRTAGAWDFERWARKNASPADIFKPASKTIVQPGDILVLKISHICLAVAGERNGRVATVEGNTNLSGSREGGGVYLRSRSLGEIRSVIRLKQGG